MRHLIQDIREYIEKGMSLKFKTFEEAYQYLLRDILENYDEYNTVYDKTEINRRPKYEKHHYSFYIMNPSMEPVKTADEKRNTVIRKYSMIEREIFDKGDLKELTRYGKIWSQIANPDGTINANYGHMVYHIKDAGCTLYDPVITSQWDWAKSRLIKRLTCKQAYIHFNRPMHQWKGNLDQPCTMYIQFLVTRVPSDKSRGKYEKYGGEKKEEKEVYQLNLCGNMRSNDAVYGTPYNIGYFMVLLYRMLEQLKPFYPDLCLGYYYHHTTSIHIYAHQKEMALSMLHKR